MNIIVDKHCRKFLHVVLIVTPLIILYKSIRNYGVSYWWFSSHDVDGDVIADIGVHVATVNGADTPWGKIRYHQPLATNFQWFVASHG